MKTIGMIGGMSWESTQTYYRLINTVVKDTLSGFHSAKCVLYSVDFHDIEACQRSGDWEQLGNLLAEAAQCVEKAGADFIILCTNTMHKVIAPLQAAVSIPFLHIADLTVEVLLASGIQKVALLGTVYTMEEDFYKARLAEKGLEVIIPEKAERDKISDIIYNELCVGMILPESKAYYLQVIDDLYRQGAQGVILGCTEIGLLISEADTQVPLFDTAKIHASEAARYALGAD